MSARTAVAVVGLAVRAPGGIANPDAYWSALMQARDLLDNMPAERRARWADQWDGLVTRGGYLDRVFDFDARFFGISPKEARTLDPQHRLLLETAWEAFEDAAIPIAQVADDTGLFVGITGLDYRQWLSGEPNSYVTVGNGHSFAAGRVAFTLGLRGPVIALDTACSSSLVAVHVACHALSVGDCDVALAGGVNLVLAPDTTRAVMRTGALSPTGSSRPFDAAADGFVRAEGCGMLLLKRLEDACRDRDRVLAVIIGTGVNHDGRTAAFTTPSVQAQQTLIRTVLAQADVPPADIGYHEAHGTGTLVGDPAEMKAIISAFEHRDGQPLYVGSVKGNLGHAEAAAGVLGLIKTVLCVTRRVIAPQANFSRLNPRIDLRGTTIVIPTAPVAWDERLGRCASVSSYGMSGTNAFAVLAPAPFTEQATPGPVNGFVISAACPDALTELAARYAACLTAMPAVEYPAFASTATGGRSRLPYAAWVAADDTKGAVAALTALASGRPHPAVRMLAPRDPVVAPLTRMVISIPTYPWRRATYVATPG